MASNQRINETLDNIINLMVDLKRQLSEVSQVAPSNPAVPIEVKAQSNDQQLVAETNYDDFESLKQAINSNKWPEAVNPHLICDPNSTEDKIERGRGIIELMVEEDLKNLKVLDFGCGEGHTIALSSDYKTSLSVGYDIKDHNYWREVSNKANLLFTSDYQTVVNQGPYDVIILFDVLDHVVNESPVSILAKARELLSNNGKIYMRTHPFVSRHATHLYHDLNKAYVHLVFTPEELRQLVPNSKYVEPSINVTTPINTYDKFIKEAGLKATNRRDITEKVEPFFKIPRIADRIMKNTKMNFFPEFQMSLQFLDYVLTKA
jgi:2-polyprenyl-3-methyl-5-hydroxy-6-metoxy-1,4-benzoquinol methylase